MGVANDLLNVDDLLANSEGNTIYSYTFDVLNFSQISPTQSLVGCGELWEE
jgi:hypothetical protein